MADQTSEHVADVILEDQLVDIWPEYPCLYDVRSSEFKNRDARDKALQEIAENLGQTVDWVKAKIKALRNAYTRVKKPPPSGSARKNLTKRSSWLLDKLKFLSPFVATRVPISNIDTATFR
ncbi:uncharacterized protein LOC124445960 [Xenia sp. Carnegie-2017]|uniref:uncharacterized protein LOC124445960 n=1 Tax=Xenia sp. Carnegie-2017 TaxID=2897299 RepID=UPI001F0341DE|nr:uncharacterized protein LOC124445960 [Xenia sp. Carnegie-2017]